MVSARAIPPRLALDVLRYFLRNPSAVDDLEGVARWRLMDEAVHRNVVETGEALGWLVASGFLTRSTRTGVPPVFGLNAHRRRAAATWVAAQHAAAVTRAQRSDPPGAPRLPRALRTLRSDKRQGRTP